jgi:epoxyqueuosine reductase
MLVTPSNGPRIRLRALLIDAEIRPTGPIAFDPCADCSVYCRKVCPEHAMDEKAPIFRARQFSERLPGGDGTYNRERCNVRMEKDDAEGLKNAHGPQPVVKYCRKCEFVCPAGR